ncbi:SDR family NAD(P)-dependent oxidoreductase [Mycolicibacterium pyrenivorans]|uniref:SDR family NAD(P)-dependent oxidoreductase n=1 Tax=Mycolicibacterium pyrenivorans TaxID=187102 RepID=UPI0021F32CAA|nr:SDR family NAD(P)-dependent oxidoreductase [Mycolicibacterium pyrenivorans]MCV7153729.1 SDR family NAD(P)-dependent oxidoreductase [Mycolicibacterium pyrenivorans]
MRGLGLASAAHLYRAGWTVVAAMRSVDEGLARLREETDTDAADPRIVGVQLDLTDPASVARAAADIQEAVGAPYALVHNAGITAAGMVGETPVALWEKMFATNVFGPVALTQALLPSMRAAGRGRIVLVSSESGVRGMPATAPYSAVKAALERWGESMAGEIGPFGIGVSVLVTGTYDTDSITDAGTTDCRVLDGPYARHHRTMDKRGRAAMRYAARSPEAFAAGLAKALEGTRPFDRRAVGPDARMLMIANRVLPPSALHHMVRLMMGIPRFGAVRSRTTDGDSP